MSAAVKLREIDRGANGKLSATLEHTSSRSFVLFSHAKPDGSAGGRLVVLLEEIPVLLDVLRSAQQLASGKHRTVRASAEELELDRKLF